NDAIHALAVRLLGFQPKPELLAPTIRLRPAFARTLDEDRTLRVRAPLRLDMQNSSQGVGATARRRAGAIARRPPPNPRGGPSALAGKGASRSGSVSVTTHTLSLRSKSSAN